MQPSTPSNICPTCKSPIPGDAPGGLCPACTLEKAAKASETNTGRRRSAPPIIAEIAPHFPDLEILELQGTGGMGAVYKARQPQLDRMVALKILSHDLASDPAFVERFNREARVLGRLSHPNIVAVFDFGTAGPFCYFLMEYVDGVNLRQAMRTGGFTPSEALALVQEICSALKFAHDEGILHRDIKPENILIDSKGRVKIADFGIAKLIGEGERPDVTLTLQGSILGSPHYMAPEQIERPGDVDQRADIYSLGVVLYEMLTGELPIGRFAPPSAKAAMDARIDEIVMRTLEKEREARFQSAEEVSTSVGALAKSPPLQSQVLSSPQTSDHGSARFSLLSAALTFISIIFGIIVAYLFATFGEIQEVIRNIGAGWALFNLVVTLGTASTGFILGAWALGDIRRSGGRKTGTGFAIFAVALWPLLLLGAFGMISIRMSSSGGHGGSVSIKMVALPVLGGALAAAAFILVRGLRLWARGVTDKNGAKRHPGLARPILGAISIMVLGVASLEAISRLSNGSQEEEDYASRFPEIEMPRVVESTTSNPTSDGRMREWRLREPEFSLPVSVSAGERIHLQLELQVNHAAPETIWEGELSGPSERPAHLEVGTQLKYVSGPPGSIQELVVEWTAPRGGSFHSNSDMDGWKFDGEIASKINLADHGLQKYVIATSGNSGMPTDSGTLTLIVLHDSLDDE